jgi:hypothetical protein
MKRTAPSVIWRASNAGTIADPIIDDFLTLVCLSKKLRKRWIEAGFILAQSRKRAANAAIGLGDPTGALGYQRLGRVEAGKVCGSRGVTAEMRNFQQRPCLGELFTCLLKALAGFGCHKSTPSK